MATAHRTSLKQSAPLPRPGLLDAQLKTFPATPQTQSMILAAPLSMQNDCVLTLRAEKLIRQRPDFDYTIKRPQAFDEAVADLFYAPGLKTLDMARSVCSAVCKPGKVLLSRSTDMTVASLSEAGAKCISVGGGLTWTAYGQMIKVARRIAEEGFF